MFNLQGSEIIVILLLALVVLGPEKLPDAIRKFSQTYGELKKMGTGFQSELKSALDEPIREMKETAQMVQDAADPQKIAAEAAEDSALREAAEAADRAAITDVPISAAALAVTDPAYAADLAAEDNEQDADDATVDSAVADDVDVVAGVDDSLDADGWDAPQPDGAVEHAPPVVVNQIAAANARRPIAPAPPISPTAAEPTPVSPDVAESAAPLDADVAAR